MKCKLVSNVLHGTRLCQEIKYVDRTKSSVNTESVAAVTLNETESSITRHIRNPKSFLVKMSAAQISHEIFSAFAVYAGLVLVKTLIMSFLTARQRIGKGVGELTVVN